MNTALTVRMLQVVAITVGTALLFWSIGLPTFLRIAEAASITSASDTISNSTPSAGSNHTIVFTTPNGMTIGQNFTLEFESPFNTTAIDLGDIDLLASGTPQTIATTSAAGVWGVTGVGTDNLTFQTPTNVGAASSTIFTIRIGTNAVTGVTGNEQIVNPSATTSYYIDINGTMQDSGQVRIAVVDNVIVSASVETSLTFTVSGVASGQSIGSVPTTTATATTPTTLPFETLAQDVSKTLAQDLSVLTNATNGFVVTVQQTGNLQSSTGADIDGFIDGLYTNTPSPWQGPGGLVADPDTYGHWGITSTDADYSVTSDRWVAASTTPRTIFSHTGPADGVTAGSGAVRVGYQAEVTGLQEAGDDYNTTLRYIATPTF